MAAIMTNEHYLCTTKHHVSVRLTVTDWKQF